MKLNIEIDETEIKGILLHHVREKLGDVSIKAEDIVIEVKSKQNFRSEWERADFRATLNKSGA